jgi:hypothetical protein
MMRRPDRSKEATLVAVVVAVAVGRFFFFFFVSSFSFRFFSFDRVVSLAVVIALYDSRHPGMRLQPSRVGMEMRGPKPAAVAAPASASVAERALVTPPGAATHTSSRKFLIRHDATTRRQPCGEVALAVAVAVGLRSDLDLDLDLDLE